MEEYKAKIDKYLRHYMYMTWTNDWNNAKQVKIAFVFLVWKVLYEL